MTTDPKPDNTPVPAADDITVASAGSAFLARLEQAQIEELQQLQFWREYTRLSEQTIITKGTETRHLRQRRKADPNAE